MNSLQQITGLSIVWKDPLWLTPNFRHGNLGMELISYSHTLSSNWGCLDATIGLQVSRAEAEDWFLNGLGREILVRNPGGEKVWRGFVDQVDMVTAGISASIGPLSKIANRVYCVYNPTYILPSSITSGGEIEEPAIQDTTSQARYGVWENCLNAGSCVIDTVTGYNEAAAAQGLYLAQFKQPEVNFQTTNQGGIELRLSCKGYYEFFNAYLYNSRLMATSPVTETLTAHLTSVIGANVNPSVISSSVALLSANAALIVNKETNYKTARSVIESVLAAGDGSNNVWLFYLNMDNVAVYKAAPTTPEYVMKVINQNQTLEGYSSTATNPLGAEIAPWDVKAGKVVFLADWMTSISGPPGVLGSDIRLGLIDQVRYDAPWSFNVSTQPINKLSTMLARKGLGGY